MPKSVELVDQAPFVLGPFGPAEQLRMGGMKLPDFKTEAQERKFWEKHSIADYWKDLRSLSFEERLTMMRKKSKEMLKQLVELGYRKPFEIVKRSSPGRER